MLSYQVVIQALNYMLYGNMSARLSPIQVWGYPGLYVSSGNSTLKSSFTYEQQRLTLH